jgi:hypothetical protein
MTEFLRINKYTLAMDIFKIKIDSTNFMFLKLTSASVRCAEFILLLPEQQVANG